MDPCLVYCFIVILLYTDRKRLLKRNLTTMLPWKFKLSGKFHLFNGTDGSNEMLKNN